MKVVIDRLKRQRRFKLSKTTDFNLSVDYAVGKDSDAWYFYVRESF